MAKICDSCISKGTADLKDMPPVPFAVHESAVAWKIPTSQQVMPLDVIQTAVITTETVCSVTTGLGS